MRLLLIFFVVNCKNQLKIVNNIVFADGETRTRNPWITNPVL